jgi:hypothetical protein
MAENKININGLVNKLAIISDAIDNLLPESKTTILFELSSQDFEIVKKELKSESKENDKLLKIDISGREYVFILNGLLSDEINNS